MKRLMTLFSVLALALWTSSAWADVEQIKIYKKAFSLDKAPKCVGCHTAEKPKKDADHELNDYGKKVKALAEKPDEEAYKKAGQIPAAA